MPLHVFRNSVLGGMEIRTTKGGAENIIKIGCACFGTLQIVRYYCLLLQELGIDYAFLSKEYCCLSPALYRVLGRGEDRGPIDEEARKMLALNNDQARKLGAKNMVYFCPWCIWKAKWLVGDSDINQFYIFDILTSPERWKGKRLRLEKKIGYMGGRWGCGENARLRVYVPESVPAQTVGLPWEDYRKLLDRVEGLTVVDLVPYTYPQSQSTLWEQMRQHNLDTIVVDHPVEYGGLSRKASKAMPGAKVRFLADILLQALGWTPWG